jgi:hypothetical protein
MTISKSLPARPSLASLRKQAKKLARETAAGDPHAISRVRAQAPKVDLPLTQRNAQLVIAREYGYAGWQDLTAEVSKRLGHGLEWAAAQARRIIHDNDIEGLKQLLAEYPALLSWRDDEDDDDGGVLGMATGAYGDAGDPERERWFTRADCAELLIDAGAIVMPSVLDGILTSRAKGLLALFQRKGLLPRNLKFFAALGDLDAVRAALEVDRGDQVTVIEAFTCACRFGHETVASALLERCISLDPDLGRHVDGSVGRPTFIKYFIEHRPAHAMAVGPWRAFVMEQVKRAILDDDLSAFVRGLQREPWLQGDAGVGLQVELIESATLNNRGPFIEALFNLDPALLRRQPPPPSQAIEHALTYANAHLVPLLTRVWPLPDDLPHAAGIGDLARVKRWFDVDSKPALGDVANHAPATSVHPREPQWGGVGVQEVLDTALAWSAINRHFDVADFLLEHGANINTNWNSHEPASILHHLVFVPGDYEAMRFLIDRGIDMTIRDYRWNSTAQGWARYGKGDEQMAQWLADAEHRRGRPQS